MMKPTEKQMEFIDLIINQLKTYKSTNDLYSPTHNGDNDEVIYNLVEKFDLNKYDEEDLKQALRDILTTMKQIK